MCAAISEDGMVERRSLLGSYNAAHLIVFLNEIEQACQGEGVKGSPMSLCGTMSGFRPIPGSWPQTPILSFLQHYWENKFSMEVEGVRSPSPWTCHPPSGHGWCMRRHQCRPMSSLDLPCQNIFPQCMNNEDIHCDVDENLWPNSFNFLHLITDSTPMLQLYLKNTFFCMNDCRRCLHWSHLWLNIGKILWKCYLCQFCWVM
jgi:hypothetical protein